MIVSGLSGGPPAITCSLCGHSGPGSRRSDAGLLTLDASGNYGQGHAGRFAVGLRRLCPIATRRRSMSGAPKSSLQRPTAAARRDHASIRQGQAGGSFHGRRRRSAHARQDAQTRHPPLPAATVQRVVALALSAPPREASHWDRSDAGEGGGREFAIGAAHPWGPSTRPPSHPQALDPHPAGLADETAAPAQ